MTRRVFAGRIASHGVANGTLQLDLAFQADAVWPASGVVSAIAATLRQLHALQARSHQLGREILDFQVELLEDDALVADILAQAQSSGDNVSAIRDVLGRQIGHLEGSRSEQFASRASDLIDLRDRLISTLEGRSTSAMHFADGAILFSGQLTPSRFLEIDWTRVIGVACETGSPSSHVAILARTRGIPMLVGVGPLPESFEGHHVLLNALTGELVIDPEPGELIHVDAPVSNFGSADPDDGFGRVRLPDGTCVDVNLSLISLAGLDEGPSAWFDSIGLVRTEMILQGEPALRDGAMQRAVYDRLFDWADGKPVSIRLFDVGGDKPVEGLTLPHEANAFLGLRGARLLLRHDDIIRTQIRAIVESARGRPARILVPMVTLPREMEIFRTILREECPDHSGVSLGMMVETPAAALTIEQFNADFYTIGMNDLIQYTMAVARDSDALDLGDRLSPAVLSLIARVAGHGKRTGRPVALCGGAVYSPTNLLSLLDCGIRSLTVAGRFAPLLKRFIRASQ